MRISKLVLVCVWLAPLLFAQSRSERVIKEALKPSSLKSNLQLLTDQVGGRVSGTPAMEHAVQWAVDAFKAAGADEVHTEDFSLLASWAEGETRLNVVSPYSFSVRAVSLAWAPALAPAHRIPIADVGEGDEKGFSQASGLEGAIVLVRQGEMKTWKDLDAEYERATGIIDRAVKAKALAIAFESTRPRDLLYRHTNTVAGEIDRMPMVLVAREDAERMARLMVAGQKLYADIAVPNEIGGPVKSSNVIAELRGSEKPNEFVILGAHLDSWELGTGALDNGCNSALVIDALRAIKASGARPKRSIRFILFSGEEEGLVGSRYYAHDHRSELDRAVAMLVIDAGVGKITGFSVSGRKDLLPRVKALIAPLQGMGPLALENTLGIDTDNFDFAIEGIPALNASQQESNYLINYHASSDTFDKVDIPQLKNHVALMSALAFMIADDVHPLAPRLNRQQVEQMLRETHADEVMKSAGIWKDWESGLRGRTD